MDIGRARLPTFNALFQVFGVVENPDGTYHSEADTSATFRPLIVEGRELHRQSNSEKVRPAPQQGASGLKVNLPARI